MKDYLATIMNAVINQNRAGIEDLVRVALNDSVDPGTIINEALIVAMDVVGKKFSSGEFFVPEMLVSAMTMKSALEIVKPYLKNGQTQSRGKVILATVKGDLHDIGKNLVAMMLEGTGFHVYDLGINIDSEKIVEKVKEINPDVLGLSALLTTTMPEMAKIIQLLKKRGLRNRVKVVVGGAPINRAFAEEIGADDYGADAGEAVTLAKKLIDS